MSTGWKVLTKASFGFFLLLILASSAAASVCGCPSDRTDGSTSDGGTNAPYGTTGPDVRYPYNGSITGGPIDTPG